MKKKGKQTNNGITLIALVITIIVLLILAGVTIATLTGDNGILTRASQASEENTHATVYESLLLEVTNYYTEKNLGNTTDSLEDYLKSKNIIDDDMVINVNNLVKQTLSLGNGNLTDGDYYRLEEIIETGNQSNELTKVASTREIKIAATSDNTKQYKIVYYGTSKTAEWESDPINTSQENGKQSLGKLADVVEVGDYINYAPTYTNISTGNDDMGNGWRVAYVDSASGVVTLVSEGVPLSEQLSNGSASSNRTEIDFDFEEINQLFDDTVASNIDILTLEDVQLLCNQAGYTLTHTEAIYNPEEYIWQEEGYSVNEDNLNILEIGTDYLLNTVGTNGYGNQSYFYGGYDLDFSTGGYYGDIGIRLVIDLKSDLECYGGTGIQGDPYQIY